MAARSSAAHLSAPQESAARAGAPSAGPWTAPDLDNLPHDGQRYEIVDGCLYATPPADADHQRLVDHVVTVLGGTAPPNWLPGSGTGVQAGESYLVPDVVVLRPGTDSARRWVGAADVALVVEVESPETRRVDRHLKPTVYADAGIESYWRVERTLNGPIAHLYTRAAAGHYHLHRSVHAGQCVTAELPYAVQVAPASWH